LLAPASFPSYMWAREPVADRTIEFWKATGPFMTPSPHTTSSPPSVGLSAALWRLAAPTLLR
jgi:hypothetical protein